MANMKSWSDLRNNWERVKPKVHEHWPELSEEEVNEIEGREDRLIEHLTKYHARPRGEVEREIRDFIQGMGSYP